MDVQDFGTERLCKSVLVLGMRGIRWLAQGSESCQSGSRAHILARMSVSLSLFTSASMLFVFLIYLSV